MRYALYISPPADDPLTKKASAWLGRDAFGEMPGNEGSIAGIDHDTRWKVTADPRRYGFHATIKAPFRLADGRHEDELMEAAAHFAAGQSAFKIPRLALAAIGPFFALVEDEPMAALARFAEAVVREFEPFRAPLTPQDMVRRRPERLNPRERQLLEEFGYPYVLDMFQFHMSLTGPVPVEDSMAVHAALKLHFGDFIARPLSVSHLALFQELEPGADFTVRALFPLAAERT